MCLLRPPFERRPVRTGHGCDRLSALRLSICMAARESAHEGEPWAREVQLEGNMTAHRRHRSVCLVMLALLKIELHVTSCENK